LIGYGPALTPQKLVEFVGKDGNILLLTSPSSIPEQSRELCRELEIDIPPRDYLAVDHFNYDRLSASERHDLILIPRPMRSRTTQSYFSQRKNSEGDNDEIIAFRGAGHTLSNKPLLFPILTASNTAYTYDTRESSTFADDPSAAGSQMHYVTAFQSRNNARITISGSTDLFSNELFDMQVQAPSGKKTTTANRAFAKELTQWTFKETGIVKVAAIRHFLSNETHPEINPSIYRVKNDVVC
jgi:oligosaccharyltransferase complex subunit beta